MKKTKVIGVGSSFGADFIAYKVIEKLKEKKIKTLALEYNDRPGIGLLESIKEEQIVYFIDALYQPESEGKIMCFKDLNAFIDKKTVSSHQVGLIETLRLGEVLGLLPQKFKIYTIAIGNSPLSHYEHAIMQLVNQLIAKHC